MCYCSHNPCGHKHKHSCMDELLIQTDEANQKLDTLQTSLESVHKDVNSYRVYDNYSDYKLQSINNDINMITFKYKRFNIVGSIDKTSDSDLLLINGKVYVNDVNYGYEPCFITIDKGNSTGWRFKLRAHNRWLKEITHYKVATSLRKYNKPSGSDIQGDLLVDDISMSFRYGILNTTHNTFERLDIQDDDTIDLYNMTYIVNNVFYLTNPDELLTDTDEYHCCTWYKNVSK